MTMRVQTTIDTFQQLVPRHAARQERKPGLRERHAAHRERLSPEPRRKMITRTPQTPTQRSATFCHTSGVEYNQPAQTHVAVEPEIRTSLYKELSTIEDIRKDMKATSSRKQASKVSHVPDWMLNLDINLDVTSVDIIPPFESEAKKKTESYNENVDMSLLYDDGYDDYSSDDDVELDNEETYTHIETVPTDTVQTGKSVVSTAESDKGFERSGRSTSAISGRSGSKTPTSMLDSYGPRRYQGDKKVMSMQQGGIRSTPMQPKSKKFINQMITYRHMKIHDNKLQKAKAAVDTKMPSTFQIALDRKRLVETRLSGSFDTSSTQSLSQTRSLRSSQSELNRSRSKPSAR